ncbi:MAG TPA: glycosyltransferase family 39 protein [Anaerolineales bacterium]
MMKKSLQLEVLAAVLISIGFVAWSWAFIYSTSFATLHETRMYCLVDDAMISMRYAWNFSHGHGLVWNPGEYVQGYTNLLMTLLMALATLILSKTNAVLSVQIAGVVFMLVIAWLTMQIADQVVQEPDPQLRAYFRTLAFTGSLAYYPLVYSSLLGMETGLLTALQLAGMLLAFRYANSGRWRTLLGSAIFFGLAFLTRNESIIFFLAVWTYLLWNARTTKQRTAYVQMLTSAGLVFVIGAAELLFQYLYYGSVLPNTYTLKLTGMPILLRLANGLGAVGPFLKEDGFILTLALVGCMFPFTLKKVLLASFFVLAAIYQVYIGGDSLPYWRMFAPVVPLLLILALEALSVAAHAAARLPLWTRLPRPARKVPAGSLTALFALLVFATVLASANRLYYGEFTFAKKPFKVQANLENVRTAIVLNDILKPQATIGVFWAGAIPYYTDFRAVDFLGKSDPYIASLPPDMSGSIAWNGMFSVPGHNKYDLNYSIVTLRPTYIQGEAWGTQSVVAWASAAYTEVTYRNVRLALLRRSPDVLWSKLTPP